MLKPCVILLVCIAFITVLAQETPAPSKGSGTAAIPPEAMQMPNPVKPTPDSLAQGKKYYGYDCVFCHGVRGDGKGEVAVSEKMSLKNWSDASALKDKTDGELFYIIKNGKGQMPPEGDRVKPTEIWNMVNYIRSFSKPTGQ
jgi:mono/diheme cytochrome c family protein